VPNLIAIARRLSGALETQRFGPPVAHVYDPPRYAREPHEAYLRRFCDGPREVLLLGMNPGPFGMAQTGVPFGDPAMVRGFLGIEGRVERPAAEHPRRPVLGFASTRAEVSGARLWGWVRDRFGAPEPFFRRFAVLNYCPLAFLESSGRNRTPDKLPAAEQSALFDACDRALVAAVEVLRPRWVVGVGAFAEARVRAALPDFGGRVGRILHPSPASPAANRGWAAEAERQLRGLGIGIP
jgi:single-strand selective monofunctional uracil DNA glycosylase